MGCTFCATGTMGFKNNLTTGEIVEQLVHASRLSPIRNIVFMVITVIVISQSCFLWNFISILLILICYYYFCWQGMGEPLNNYTALVEAIRVMTAYPFQLSPKKITVSTVCLLQPPSIYSFNNISWFILYLFISFV